MTTQNIYKHLFIASLVITFVNQGCKKLIEIDPPMDKYTSEKVFNDKVTAVSTILSIYATLHQYALMNISVGTSLMADELVPPSTRGGDEYLNRINSNTFNIWDLSYRTCIYRANSIIEGVSNSDQISSRDKKIILAEAKFIRAFIYFYLVNLYGDVPLVLSTNFTVNSNIARSPVKDVYNQIIGDLIEARSNLPAEYLDPDLESNTHERIRPNSFAASSLLSRVYLYTQNWEGALQESSRVIDHRSLYELSPLNEVFLKNSKEAIWQLQPNPKDVDGNFNASDAFRYFMPSFEDPYFVSPLLMDMFYVGDERRLVWLREYDQFGVKYIVPNKYKVGGRRDGEPMQPQAEYNMILRLGEQYLIRAEAKAELGDFEGAKDDINVIRNRAGLHDVASSNMDALIGTIDRERQVELFTEWGDRWLNLKRRNLINDVMKVVAPNKIFNNVAAEWSPHLALLPIPTDEFRNNAALRGHQNPGYQESGL